MDSGNSSSMQSSSGGDEQEYDSRSLFHNNNNNMNMMMKPPPPPPQQQQQQQLQNWAPPPPLLSFTATAPPVEEPPQKKAGGPSKKRTRASRRAPTTVLTTDTTNFRAMVQEFTGIPDPPFSSSRRLDLFSTAGSSMRLAAPPFRPAPQRLPPTSLYGSGQSDPTLAFQSLIQQPLLFPPPFGMNMGGGLMSAMDPPLSGNGLGFLSSSQPDHGGTSNPNNNNNYVTSHGNAEYHNN